MSLTVPGLCDVLARPLRWLPQRVHEGGLSMALNHLLAQALAQGELDFLSDKVVGIEVADLGIRYRLRLDVDGFVAAPASHEVDVRFSGDAYTFLLLATQREDADSLFFQRLLRIEGDTATGLHLKNFLDSLGDLSLPRPAREALERFTDLFGRHCAGTGQSHDGHGHPVC